MSLFSTEELLTSITTDDAIVSIKNALDEQDFEGDFDNPQSPERIFTSITARAISDCGGLAAYLHSGSLNDYAEGDQLTSLSLSHFGNERGRGTATQGDIIIHFDPSVTDSPSRTWSAGELLIEYTNVTKMKFYNTGTISLTVGGNLSGTFGFIAETTGVDGNIDNDEDVVYSLIPADVAISCSFPTSDIEWWNVEGTDTESDSSLKNRNSLSFSQFASGSIVRNRVKKIIFDNVPAIKDVYVDGSNPNGPYTVQLFVSSDLTTATPTDVSSSLAAVQVAFFDSNMISCKESPEEEYATPLTIYYDNTIALSNIKSSVNTYANNWIKSLSIGGQTLGYNTNVVSPTGLVHELMKISSIKNVIPSNTNLISLKNGSDYEKLVAPSGGWDSVITYTAS